MKRNFLLVLMLVGLFFGAALFNITQNRSATVNSIGIEDTSADDPSSLKEQSAVTKSFLTDTGTFIETGLYANISATETLNSPYYEDRGNKYFNLPINTNHQNISQTNLTFSGITAQNSSQIIEDNPENF
ncbi:MAG: hypothetical protein LUQ65_02860, partial [Candidatus Helarchaeota archaeon]|nr:hypothetical protein [Candidatus Helarchaeota archaeon]